MMPNYALNRPGWRIEFLLMKAAGDPAMSDAWLTCAAEWMVAAHQEGKSWN